MEKVLNLKILILIIEKKRIRKFGKNWNLEKFEIKNFAKNKFSFTNSKWN